MQGARDRVSLGVHERAAAPIGIFDSGLGGLTVARALGEELPGERLIYLGDTARVPYGTRSAETVVRYARACGSRLRTRGIKALVVACNTVSAVALEALRAELDLPVLGVIEPGARAAAEVAQGGRIGVIATAGTVASGGYVRAVAAVDSRAEVIAHAAPLLVPLVEEGWLEGELPRLAARRYLEPLARARIDVLVLGCTHYPLLEPVLRAELDALVGRPLPIIDSAAATAREVGAFLRERGLITDRAGGGALELLVTDLPARFADVASRFLGRDLGRDHVEQIDL